MNQNQPAAQPAIDLELNIVNDGVVSHPDKIRIHFTPDLIAQIARALNGIELMDVGFTEVTFDFRDDCEMFEDGAAWIQAEKEAGAGHFDPSCFWLKIQAKSFQIEIWDEQGDSVLHGGDQFSAVPGLVAVLEVAQAKAHSALRALLLTADQEEADRPVDRPRP